jgi:hypothetical protein
MLCRSTAGVAEEPIGGKNLLEGGYRGVACVAAVLSSEYSCSLFELHAKRRIWAIRNGVNEGRVALAHVKYEEVFGPRCARVHNTWRCQVYGRARYGESACRRSTWWALYLGGAFDPDHVVGVIKRRGLLGGSQKILPCILGPQWCLANPHGCSARSGREGEGRHI